MDFINIKNKFYFFFSITTIIIFTSCSNLLESSNKNVNNKNIALLRIETSNVRTIMPENPSSDSFDKYTLTGTMDSSTEKILGEWDSYSKMTTMDVILDIGTWNFTLTATKTGNIYRGSVLNKEIVAGSNNTISFELVPDSYSKEGKGKLSVSFFITNATNDTADKITAELEKKDGTRVGDLKQFTELVSSDKTIQVMYNEENIEVDSGFYRITWTVYKHNCIICELSELIFVSDGLLSTGEISITSSDLNSVNKITYENIDDCTFSDALPEYYTLNSGLKILPKPKRASYTFIGWCIGTADGEDVSNGWKSGTKNGDVTIIATWMETPITEITLNKTKHVLATDDKFQLHVNFVPEDALNKEIIWTSNDELIAMVSETGLVTAKSVGDVKITAISKSNNSITAEFSLHIDDTYKNISEFTKDVLNAYLEDYKDYLSFVDGYNSSTDKLSNYISEFTIPSGCTSIEKGAFSDCYKLTEITIPFVGTSKTATGTNAYFQAIFGNNSTIYKAIKKVNIMDGVICGYAFSGCTGLEEVFIGDNVISIGDSAFLDCRALTKITIGDGVISIGNNAFQRCYKLNEIIIGKGVNSFGNWAFSDCTLLENVRYMGNITDWNNIAFAASISNPLCYAKNFYLGTTSKEPITEIIIDGVTEIRQSFKNFIGIEKVTIGDNVKTIGNSAFYYCKGLKEVKIGDNVTSIGEFAFSGCTELTKVIIGNNVTEIGNSAFSGCLELNEININNNVTAVGNSAFSGCIKLREINMGNSITTIGNYAFSGCTGLIEIKISASVMSIGSYAFEKCSGISDVHYMGSIVEWCNITFSGNTSNPMYYAENFYFDNLSSEPITEIIISEDTTSIGDYAFANCNRITKIIISDSVTTIGKYAFYGCTEVNEITLGKNITIIGFYAFYACSAISDIYYTGDIASWCNITFSDYSNPMYYADYFYLGTSSTEPVSEVRIPNNVTSIGNCAFYGYKGIKEISLPESIISIGNYAFYGCTGVKEIIIPDSVTSIGIRTFANCTKLTEISIGTGVNSIGREAFYGCSSLASVRFLDTKSWKYASTTTGTIINVTDSAVNAINLKDSNGEWSNNELFKGNR